MLALFASFLTHRTRSVRFDQYLSVVPTSKLWTKDNCSFEVVGPKSWHIDVRLIEAVHVSKIKKEACLYLVLSAYAILIVASYSVL